MDSGELTPPILVAELKSSRMHDQCEIRAIIIGPKRQFEDYYVCDVKISGLLEETIPIRADSAFDALFSAVVFLEGWLLDYSRDTPVYFSDNTPYASRLCIYADALRHNKQSAT